MNAEFEKKDATRPTGKRYGSVKDLLQGENVSPNVQSKVEELRKETALTEILAKLRMEAGLTQQQVAERFGMSQSAISKLESGRDEELTLGEIRKYAELTGQRIGVVLGKPLNHVEAVKVDAMDIKRHLTALAELAHRDEEMEKAIQGFFGEAFFNILDILSKCHLQMPNNSGVQLRVELFGSSKPSTPPQEVADKAC
jgi:transcriptional regulator with XRE-family HTH domain